MFLNISEESYFLADADDYKESSEYYWLLAQEIDRFIKLSPSQLVQEIDDKYDEYGFLKKPRLLEVFPKKSRIISQRFKKHPYPELSDVLYVQNSIVEQHVLKRLEMEGDKDFLNDYIKSLNDVNLLIE